MGKALLLQEKRELLVLLEEKRRHQARNDLNAYCQFIPVPGAPISEDEDEDEFYPDSVIPAKHHRLINDTLMKVERRERCPDTGYRYRNVMVFMPPGSAKSTYGTVCFPSYYMGRNPGRSIITTSYASNLALKFGRKVRQIVRSTEYGELFPDASLVADNRAVDNWSLTNLATYMTGGILSGITGNRADGLVIDDPTKGHEDAESPTLREKTWEAYRTDLRTRVKPSGFKLIIQTRWNEDDLSGRILPRDWDGQSGWVIARDGEPWYVICLQAQCEREDDPLGRDIGEWLWTEWFPVEHWEQEKKSQGPRNFEALYQQRPKPAEGAMIKRSWPNRYDLNNPPTFDRLVLSIDTAYKTGEENDPSVLSLWGEIEQRKYLVDVVRDKVEYPALRSQLVDYYLTHKPHIVLIEDKASGQSLLQECRAGIYDPERNRTVYVPTVAVQPNSNKGIRMSVESTAFSGGLVYLPESAPWLPEYEREVFGFPLVGHDDQVDSTSQFLAYSRATPLEFNFETSGTQTVGHSSFGVLSGNRPNNYEGF